MQMRCVKPFKTHNQLTEGKIYTVREVAADSDLFEYIGNNGDWHSCFKWRFEPLLSIEEIYNSYT
jgi:hypothetical protein